MRIADIVVFESDTVGPRLYLHEIRRVDSGGKVCVEFLQLNSIAGKVIAR